MVAPRYRSRSAKRLQRTTPSGRRVLHHGRARPGAAHCSRCGAVLHGVPRGKIVEIAKLSKTEKRPQRIFGGNLCSACTREKIRAAVQNRVLGFPTIMKR